MTLKMRVITAFAAIAVLMLAAGSLIVHLERSTLSREFDIELRALRQPAKSLVTKAGTAAASKSSRLLTGAFVGVVGSDGTVRIVLPVAASPRVVPVLAPHRKYAKPTTVRTLGGSGSSMRVMTVVTRSGEIVVVGRTLDFVSNASAGLVRELVLIGLIMLVLLALIFWWIVRLGLAPIAAVTSAARSLRNGDVSQRAPEFPAGTEARELADAFNVLVETNQQSQATLRQFVADASHELRTPLATLTGYASLYSQGGLQEPGAVDDAMHRIRQEALRMTRLVDDLLVLARMDDLPTMKQAKLDLVPLVVGVVSDLRILEPHRTIATRLPSAAWVYADSDHVIQALTVYLDNARKYTPAGTGIDVTVAATDTSVRVTVRDHGPGLEPSELDHVFDRFFRTNAGRSAAGSGAGLGLAIARTLIVANGGTVGASSAPGVGSEFWFDLPAQNAM